MARKRHETLKPPTQPEDFQRVLEAVNEGVSMLDEQNRFVYVNDRLCEMLGYGREEMLGQTPLGYLDEENRARFLDERARRESGATEPYELTLRRRDGSGIRVLVSPRPRFGSDGAYRGSLSVITDITPLKRAREELARSEATARALLDASPDTACLLTPEGEILACNEAMARSLGVTRGELTGRLVWDFFSPEVAERRKDAIRLAVESARPLKLEDERDGRIYSAVIHPIPGARGVDRLAIYAADVTEERRLTRESHRVHKLESLGVMAGGIAHDFNNLLTGITGNVSLARVCWQSGQDPGSALEDAEVAAGRARELADQLLTFARGGEPIRQPISVPFVLKRAAELVGKGGGVSCRIRCGPRLWLARADERQLVQVLEQLITNAIQAMPGGGAITLGAQNQVVGEDGFAGLPHITPGKYVKVSVADEGPGIGEQHLDRIFDPFFSTRKEGKGLGLSIAYAIVKKHGGYITVSSPPGRGATFTVLVPAVHTGEFQVEESTGAPGREGSRILVMDDEPLVRDFLVRALGRLGFHVKAVEDGRQAIETYKAARAEGVPFDLVIMDLTIAEGMGGEEAIRRLLAVDPDARAVVSSGYSDSPVMAEHARYGFRGVLAKPYKIEDVERVILEALSSRS
jgi:PAS domain S-box-containing protein